MKAVTRSHTSGAPISTTLTLTETAEMLVRRALAENSSEREITLLAISVSNLVDQPVLQLELPVLPDDAVRPGSPTGSARWAVDHSMDAVRRKFGRASVGYATVALSEMANVPDEFRELAEHEL
jgi:DNA polymerase-4